KKAFKQKSINFGDESFTESAKDSSQSAPSKGLDPSRLPEEFGKLPIEDETHSALHRWEREDLEASLDHGYVGELFLCLCSEHEEIRRQAFAAIGRFMVTVKVSAKFSRYLTRFHDCGF